MATGRASNLLSPIGSSVISQYPNVPSSILFNAASIFDMSFLSLSLARSSSCFNASSFARSTSSPAALYVSEVSSVKIFNVSSLPCKSSYFQLSNF